MVKKISVRLSDKELTILRSHSPNISDAVRSCLSESKDELVFELRSQINKLETRVELLEYKNRYLSQPWIRRVLQPSKHV